MKAQLLTLALLPLTFAGTAAQAACYAVYDAQNQMVYRGSSSPVDLSRPLERQIHAIWPGAHLIIGASHPSCSSVDNRIVVATPAQTRAPAVAMMDPSAQKPLAEKKR
jgi:hypothetical protein